MTTKRTLRLTVPAIALGAVTMRLSTSVASRAREDSIAELFAGAREPSKVTVDHLRERRQGRIQRGRYTLNGRATRCHSG
jgi:hypothetical protein